MSVSRLEHFVLACEDEQALAVADERRQMSYGQLREAVLAVAGGLRSRGVAPGDRVIVALPNTVSFVISHSAVLAAGGVSVPCDPKSTAQSVAGLIADCEPVLAIAEPSVSVHFAGFGWWSTGRCSPLRTTPQYKIVLHAVHRPAPPKWRERRRNRLQNQALRGSSRPRSRPSNAALASRRRWVMTTNRSPR